MLTLLLFTNAMLKKMSLQGPKVTFKWVIGFIGNTGTSCSRFGFNVQRQEQFALILVSMCKE